VKLNYVLYEEIIFFLPLTYTSNVVTLRV
jgi:hypothetical protein